MGIEVIAVNSLCIWSFYYLHPHKLFPISGPINWQVHLRAFIFDIFHASKKSKKNTVLFKQMFPGSVLIQELCRVHGVTRLQCQFVCHLTKLWPFSLWFSSTDGVCSVVMETYEHLLSCDLSSIFRSCDSNWATPIAINETLSAEEDHEMQLKVWEKAVGGQYIFYLFHQIYFSWLLGLRVVAKCYWLVSSSIYVFPALHNITMIDQIWVWCLGPNFPVFLYWKHQYWISECLGQTSVGQLTATCLMRPTTHLR